MDGRTDRRKGQGALNTAVCFTNKTVQYKDKPIPTVAFSDVVSVEDKLLVFSLT